MVRVVILREWEITCGLFLTISVQSNKKASLILFIYSQRSFIFAECGRQSESPLRRARRYIGVPHRRRPRQRSQVHQVVHQSSGHCQSQVSGLFVCPSLLIQHSLTHTHVMFFNQKRKRRMDAVARVRLLEQARLDAVAVAQRGRPEHIRQSENTYFRQFLLSVLRINFGEMWNFRYFRISHLSF